MDWLIASLVALLDEVSEKPSGAFSAFLDERALGFAGMLSEGRNATNAATDAAVESLRSDSELITALVDEIDALNREVAELSARNIILTETQWRLEAQHESDRMHIRELIAEMVRRDIR
ncbi:MAG: hypothetical protein EA355_07320 [Rhodobacteraceae bacterium]|nr:MAG: hypothetical protein EA355_07320 [Paracoccaceae bacterium]